jgi:hypothetical protein
MKVEENFPKRDSQYMQEIVTELLNLLLELKEQEEKFSPWKERLFEVAELARVMKLHLLEQEKRHDQVSICRS